MNNDELKAIFDQQAANYDSQWAKMSPINNCLHFFLPSILAALPMDARILCVGAGTGKELIYLARIFPQWRFTAVEPSSAMVEVCRQRVEEEGFLARCDFHNGYLDTLVPEDSFDAATCFLVSQFMLEPAERSAFFGQIAGSLKPGGVLVSSDLASDTASYHYDELLKLWWRVMSSSDVSPEAVDRMRSAYAKDVAILPAATVASIIEAGGFSMPVQFFQAGLIHGWFARMKSTD